MINEVLFFSATRSSMVTVNLLAVLVYLRLD